MKTRRIITLLKNLTLFKCLAIQDKNISSSAKLETLVSNKKKKMQLRGKNRICVADILGNVKVADRVNNYQVQAFLAVVDWTRDAHLPQVKPIRFHTEEQKNRRYPGSTFNVVTSGELRS